MTGNRPDLYRQGEARTLREVLAELDAAGFGGQLAVEDAGMVRCLTCRSHVHARDLAVTEVERLEGASDPADMLAVAAVTCPVCGARGALVLNYGPETTADEADVLVALDVAGRPATGP